MSADSGSCGPALATSRQAADQQIGRQVWQKSQRDGHGKDPGTAGRSQPAGDGLGGNHEGKADRERHPPGQSAGPAARQGADRGDDDGQEREGGGPEHQAGPGGERQHHSTTISATSPPNSLVSGRSPGGACHAPPSTRTASRCSPRGMVSTVRHAPSPQGSSGTGRQSVKSPASSTRWAPTSRSTISRPEPR